MHTSDYNQYMTHLLKGYYKLVDTINAELQIGYIEDRFDVIDNMFIVYITRMKQYQRNLLKDILKKLLSHPLRAYKDYRSFQNNLSYIYTYLDFSLDQIKKQITEAGPTKPTVCKIKGFTYDE